MAGASREHDDLPAPTNDGDIALNVIKDSEPAIWLTAPLELAQRAKVASELLFALSSAYSVKCPLKKLLTDRFDSEQIWQQIDLQTKPLLLSLRWRLKHIERNSGDSVFFNVVGGNENQDFHPNGHVGDDNATTGKIAESTDSEEDEENESETEEEDGSEEGAAASSGEEDLEAPINDGECRVGSHTVEDRFLRLSDMERFLDDAEAPKTDAASPLEDNFEDGDFESDDDDMQVDELPKFTAELEKDSNIKYGDFFAGGGRVQPSSRISEDSGGEFMDMDSGLDQASIPGQVHPHSMQRESLTTHERQISKIQKRIEQLEKANIDPKLWTMQGEVSAIKRPKNSALEVELDFEHNVRPAPVITEEITASLEDIIRNRIAEDHFDDGQRKSSLSSSAPRQQIDLDENKSQKGLGELYEADYMQTTGLAPASVSPADAVRKEATVLFKSLCIRLDALSHFHFTPKPVIEDMAVRLDVPALAMEEVAPMVVSDAQMLAPEEVFTGEGAVKAEEELTREERKRRRARQKQKSKVENKRKESDKKSGMSNKPFGKASKPALQRKQQTQQSHYAKSMKVFEELDQVKTKEKKISEQRKGSQILPFLKL